VLRDFSSEIVPTVRVEQRASWFRSGPFHSNKFPRQQAKRPVNREDREEEPKKAKFNEQHDEKKRAKLSRPGW
jgi:hypothetical protein